MTIVARKGVQGVAQEWDSSVDRAARKNEALANERISPLSINNIFNHACLEMECETPANVCMCLRS